MDEPSIGVAPSGKQSDGRLDSWKEIAAYLSRDVTTAQRWEKREGMPVHRHQHDRMGSVYASRAELDAWVRTRRAAADDGNHAPSNGTVAAPAPSAEPRPRSRRVLVYLFAVLGTIVVIGAVLRLRSADYFWRSPIAEAQFQTVTDFGGTEQAAAVSRDGHFIAFLSDRDGQMDVWVTQTGSGQFHNLTHGSAPELVNASIRTLGFSPDGSLVTFWTRRNGEIGVWAVPMLGGEPRPYLEGVAEFDWSHDGSRLAYHTPGPGDPLFVTDGKTRSPGGPIFTAPIGLHLHFPSWSPDGAYLYFVQGAPPDRLDIWRIPSGGGTPERITTDDARVSYPVLLDARTLLYLACDPDGAGPWLYSMDVEHRIAHRLSYGVDRYTSLAATVDGRRIVVTAARPATTLWRLRVADAPKPAPAVPIQLTTGTGYHPRLASDALLYVSSAGSGESIWKVVDGASTQLWSGEHARIVGGPTVSSDGRQVAFSVGQQGRTLLYMMRADGTNAHVLTDSLALQGSPAWTPDGKSIVSSVLDGGVPRLFRIPMDGGPPTRLVQEYSVEPAWSPDGRFALYSGPDIGTTFSVKAISPDGAKHSFPDLVLTRGARHLVLLPDGHTLVMLRGEMQHKDVWSINLESGAQRQLTSLPADFEVRDFDITPDGRELVLERVQERSDVLLMDLHRP